MSDVYRIDIHSQKPYSIFIEFDPANPDAVNTYVWHVDLARTADQTKRAVPADQLLGNLIAIHNSLAQAGTPPTFGIAPGHTMLLLASLQQQTAGTAQGVTGQQQAAAWVLANAPQSILQALDPAIMTAIQSSASGVSSAGGQTTAQAGNSHLIKGAPAIVIFDAAGNATSSHPDCDADAFIQLLITHGEKIDPTPNQQAELAMLMLDNFAASLASFRAAHEQADDLMMKSYVAKDPSFSRWFMANKTNMGRIADQVGNQGFKFDQSQIDDIRTSAGALHGCLYARNTQSAIEHSLKFPTQVLTSTATLLSLANLAVQSCGIIARHSGSADSMNFKTFQADFKDVIPLIEAGIIDINRRRDLLT